MPLEVHRVGIKIYTVQIAQWRLCKALGIPMIDTTAKSGYPCFAPDMARVWDYKKGRITDSEYTKLYIEKMVESQALYPDRWEELKGYESFALACYCRAGEFCHRHLLFAIVQKYLEAHGIEVVPGGEITKTNTQHFPRVLTHDTGYQGTSETAD